MVEIVFPRGTDTSKQTALQPESTETYNKEGRARYVQKLLRVNDEKILAARCDGAVELLSMAPVDGTKYSVLKDWVIGTAVLSQTEKDDAKDAVVELVMLEPGVAVSCSRKGKIVRYDLAKGTSQWLAVKGPLDAFTIHSKLRSVVAVGGQERETEILELEWPEEEEKGTVKSMWEARNVKADQLHLRSPVWIKRIFFLECEEEEKEGAYKLLVVTRYGQFREYETRAGRRPRRAVTISQHPLLVCEAGCGDGAGTVVASDAKTSTFVVTMKDLKMQGKLAGSTGAVQALNSFEGLMATGGLDRYLRVFDLATRAVEAKVYVGTHITAVLVLDGFTEEENGAKRARDEEAEDDQLWDQLDEVAAKQEGRKKKIKN